MASNYVCLISIADFELLKIITDCSIDYLRNISKKLNVNEENVKEENVKEN